MNPIQLDRINVHTKRERNVDTSELYARGLRRRKAMFGEADVEKRMTAAGEFGAPLQNVINAYVYGDIWERPGLPDNIRSLVMLGITAAAASRRVSRPSRRAGERMHKGTGAGVCCWFAMYCGVPAAIEPTGLPRRFWRSTGIGDRFFRQAVIECCNEICPDDRRPPSYLRLNDLPWLAGPQVPRILVHISRSAAIIRSPNMSATSPGCDIVKIRLHPDQLAGGEELRRGVVGAVGVRMRPAGRMPVSRMRTLPIPTSVRCSKSWQNCRRRAASASNYLAREPGNIALPRGRMS